MSGSTDGVLSDPALRERLRHVYWVGGGSGAGKSTVAALLAARHGLSVFATDDAMPEHARRLSAEEAPSLAAFAAMTMDERWVSRTPPEMLVTFHWYRGEGFHLIVEDLLSLPAQPVIVEGIRVLPHLLKPLLASASHALWLLPTRTFRERAFELRRPAGAPWTFLDQTSDPARGLRNLLQRDAMFTDRLARETRQRGLRSIRVDGAKSAEHVAAEAASWFGLGDQRG